MPKEDYPKLLNCPFCGGKARIICFSDPLFDRNDFVVECRSCKASTRSFNEISFDPKDDEREAIEAWNRRCSND